VETRRWLARLAVSFLQIVLDPCAVLQYNEHLATQERKMQNVISAAQYTFTVANKQRPFSNNFVMLKAAVKQYEGQDEIHCIVKCTANSKEPGMQYFCIYSTKGKLIACNN